MAVVVWQLFHFRHHIILMFIAHLMHTFPPSEAVSKCTYTVDGITYKISAWTWIVRDGSVEYHINLCGLSISTGDCKNAAVCKLTNFKNDKANKQQNFGNYAQRSSIGAADHTGFTTEFIGTKGHCDRSANIVTRSSRVILKCGKVLGSPELTEAITEDSSCETVFEFVTSEACRNGAQSTISEIPCYVYDKETDKKINLSPLIRLTGGHAVASENALYDLHINVCREITPSKNITTSHTHGCPSGTSSCRVLKNGKKDNMGQITQLSQLKPNPFNPKQILLHYNASNTGTSCREPPSTTIVFECPELFHQASGKGPRVTADRDCHYEILWVTEYACAEAVLTNKSCVIQNEFVQFDLTPLKAPILDNYKLTAKGAKGKTVYDYFINVCDSTHIPCPTAKNASVCQVVPDTKIAYNLGVTQELRYADGELTMIYKDGDRCHSSGFKRSTIISFKCNPKVDKGKPTFNEEDACLYLFDWETKYACPPSRRTGTKCQVTSSKGVRYDLSELVRMDSMNWLAIDGRWSNSNSEIYVSVCGELMNSKGKTDKCDTSNAICIVNTRTKEARNLGKYKQPLMLNSDGSMLLNYTDGDRCKTTTDNKEIKISSVITFLCHPGDLASPPVLVSSSLDNCTYEFMWRTAAACSLGVNTGEKCRVEDQNAGYVFDLSPLSQQAPFGKDYFSVDTNTSSFFQVAVCKGSNDSSNKCVADKKHGTNIGACQVKKVGNSHVMIGQSNDVLYYYDGMINLTYSNGEPCPTNSKQKSVTHMTFLCDAKASVSSPPQYDTDDSCTHNFRWRTKYACPAKVVECAVKSGEQQFDLSSLVKTADNWYTPANGGTAYINICRSLNLNSKVRRCKGTPAVCLVPQDSSKAGINLGEVSSAPSILSSTKEIVLVYTGGDICTGNTRYQTQIHFSCKRGSADSSPKFEAVNKCVYKFHWAVAAACAIQNADGDNCVVKDPASGTTFNLMPLNTQFPNQDFTVNGTGGTRYKLSICGPLSQTCVSDSNAGACEVRSNGEAVSLGVATKKLHFQGEVISLKYINGARDPTTGRGRQVTIRFYCNPRVPLGTPKFVQQQKYEYVFDFQTSLACSAKAVQCSVTDNKGKKYDLTPLGQASGNWEAVDTRPSQRHLHYFINVCRSVNSLPGGFTCAGGGIGGCQIDHKLSKGHNMGNVQSNPQVVGDGLLTLHYFGGDSCHNNKYQRSTRINFSCSKKMGSPIFVEETVDCIYVFSWSTPFACPIKSHTGTNCAVEVQEYGYTFNLSSLYTPKKNYSVMTSNKQEIVLNVCGKLSSPDLKCTTPANAGACLKGSKVLGVANQTLTYNGDITLRYSTTKPACSVDIVFQCDTGQHNAGQGPEVVTQIDNGTMCYYRLTWNTDLACIPLAHTQCSIRVEKSESGSTYDLQYDFTSLSRRTGNWRAVNSAGDAHDVMYFINVCSSVNNEGDATYCNPTAGVCKVDSSVKDKKRYLSLGVQRSSPKKEGQLIYLLYEDGEVDPRCTGDNKRASSRIQMHCDSKDGDPLYVTFYPYLCRYEFMWQTRAACPLNKATGTAFNNCTALNPQQNNLFDLNHLHRQTDYRVQDKNQHYYLLNVCGPLSEANQKKCNSKTTGNCQLRNDQASFHHNAGNYNKRLTYQDGVLALTYDGGDYCKHSRTNRTTIISFVCHSKVGTAASLGDPVFVTESNDCIYYIDWHTSLACEKTIECLATNDKGERFDLSALKKDDGNWPVVPQGLSGKPSAMYYINVCRGLVPMPGIQCPAGSSACLVNTTNNVPVIILGGATHYVSTVTEQTLSMGRVSDEPSTVAGKEVILVYPGGSVCDTDKSTNISTNILFRCAEGSLGKPVLAKYESCIYTIIWETSAACGRNQTVDTNSCTVYDNATAHLYDLRPLKKLLQDYHDFEVSSTTPKKEKFIFNLCNEIAWKKDSGWKKGYGVCKVINETTCSGYGFVSQTSLYFSHGEKFLTLKYCDPNCRSYKKMAMIVFTCDINAYPGSPQSQPVLESSSPSQVVITWKTSLVCPPVQEGCVHSAGGFTYDLQLLSSRTRSWHYKTTDGQEFWINICGGVSDGPAGCPPSASVCRRNGDEVDVLGIASTQRMTTSDDLVVMYRGQGSVKDCQTRPSVVFHFECGSHIGRPEFDTTIWSTCTFYFKWKTRAACKIERTKLDVRNCEVTHPDTKKLVDFSQLNDRNWEVETQTSKLYISICNTLRGESLPVICQKKTVVCSDPTNKPPVAYKLASRTFFYEDLVFSLWLETTASTGSSCSKATFVINFYCSRGAGKGKPEFMYHSAACHYVFDWETSIVCVKDQSSNIVDVSTFKGPFTTAGSKAGIAFGVIFIIALLITAGVVLRKRERREYILFYIRSRYRHVFRKRDFKSPSYRYTKVDTSDDEQGDLLLNMDDHQYVDESDDEDMLHL